MSETKKLANRLLELQEFLNRFLEIERQIYIRDGKKKDRKETDTEHSYHLAMIGWYLSDKFPNLDKNKIIQYALAHDLVEIYAGDVMAIGRTYEEETQKVKREAAAKKQLQIDWPDFNDLNDVIAEYESQRSREAIFVNALDKILPMIHQILSEGKTWKIYNLERSVIIDLKDEKTKKSKEINEIWKVFRQQIMQRDDYFNKGKAK